MEPTVDETCAAAETAAASPLAATAVAQAGPPHGPLTDPPHGPLTGTLTVLLLAFVLVTANGSYGNAEVAACGEARALDQLVETAEYAPDAQRARIQADAVCYARAVRAEEWPAMSDGKGSTAPSVWSTDFRQTFRPLEGKPVFGLLIAADNRRFDERDERLTQASASIPAPSSGSCSHPRHHRRGSRHLPAPQEHPRPADHADRGSTTPLHTLV